MAKIRNDNILVAIDVGTTKICVIVAQKIDAHAVTIIGIGKAPSAGLRKGVVVDIGKTIHAIKSAVKEAEIMSGIIIDSASIGISGGHITSINSQGIVPIKRGVVRQSDIDNVLAAAKATPVPDGLQILHILPQYFIIDQQDRVVDPLDMHGIRLEVVAHIILGATASVHNLVKCCEMAGVRVTDIILEQLASAAAVLSEDEQELGVAMLDIGGGTSDLALYQNRSIRHTMVLPIAGNHFTNDVAIGLRTTVSDAERIKKQHGLAYMPLLQDDDCVEVETVHGKEQHLVMVSDLVNILQPRAQELLLAVHQEIIKHKLRAFMASGFVLTGGGALLKGMKELAEQIFDTPVRIGTPKIGYTMPEALDNPMYATAYGLIMYALKQDTMYGTRRMDGPLTHRVFDRMKSWVSDFF